MTKGYLQADGSIEFGEDYTNVITELPLGVYIPKVAPTGIYLSKTSNFEYLPEYYLLDKFEEYVLRSYNSSSKSVGALYVGLKGSGKTKRAHKLALDSGMSVIYLQDFNVLNHSNWKNIINSPLFNNVVVYIDEYEKKLKDETTVPLLEWLDGSVNTKQLFILIGNEQASNKYTNPLVDRLSRILFRKSFESLTTNDIEQLVNSLSKREDKQDLIESISGIPVISLDNCLQIIKTTNLFIEDSIDNVIALLNIQFKQFDNFIPCDMSGKKIDYACTLSLSVLKNKVAFCYPYFNIEVNSTYVDSINTDDHIDTTYDCYLRGNINEDAVVKYVDTNTVLLTCYYYYYPKDTENHNEVKSDKPVTIQLIRENFYSLLNNRISYLTF